MTDWTSLIVKDYLKNYKPNRFGLVLGEPADSSLIEQLEKFAMGDVPKDLLLLYSSHNGFGIITKGEIRWTLIPINQLIEFKESCADWFVDTHPQLKNIIVPFYSWDSGDFLCLVVINGAYSASVYEFNHEKFSFDKEQEWSEFLYPVYTSIKDIFK